MQHEVRSVAHNVSKEKKNAVLLTLSIEELKLRSDSGFASQTEEIFQGFHLLLLYFRTLFRTLFFTKYLLSNCPLFLGSKVQQM